MQIGPTTQFVRQTRTSQQLCFDTELLFITFNNNTSQQLSLVLLQAEEDRQRDMRVAHAFVCCVCVVLQALKSAQGGQQSSDWAKPHPIPRLQLAATH
jgi:hypothetical protein